MSLTLKVGCCGFPVSMSTYFSKLRLVEVQNTFYKIVKESTLKKWREKAPKDFEFTIKAFQGITHDITSPTWRKSNISDYKRLLGKVGSLRLTDEVLSFWDYTLKAAKLLSSNIILIQLPRGFKDSEESIKTANRFFTCIKRDDIRIAVELRGWSSTSRGDLCKAHNLIDVVDPLIDKPAYFEDTLYFRLHGRYERGRIVYNHRYSQNELKRLLRIIEEYEKMGVKEVYILFNNINMFNDAQQFIKMLTTSQH